MSKIDNALHIWHIDAINYATNYVDSYNYNKNRINDFFEELKLSDFKLRTLNIVFWINVDLSNDGYLGVYIPNGVRTQFSLSGLVKIDLNAHKSFNAVKHTIRHEITHGIAHQIYNSDDFGHGEYWQKIAIKNNVDISAYANK